MSEKRPTLFIVDDELDIRETLEFAFEKAGFAVECFANGQEVLTALLEEKRLPEVVVLDRSMPKCDGMVVVQKLRKNEATRELPIVLLTARGTENDRIFGLETGANDYVVKPFSTRELILRVRNVMPKSKRVKDSLKHLALEVFPEEHRTLVHGSDITLTALEFRLLVLLIQRQGEVQSRQRLLVSVWDSSPELATRAVDTTVKRLREKLGECGSYIETVRGIGYRFASKSD